jgi:excinuclease ABC subunit B
MAEFRAMESQAPRRRRRRREETATKSPEELEKLVIELEEEMLAAADDLRFEEAARIRDELKELRADLDAIRA